MLSRCCGEKAEMSGLAENDKRHGKETRTGGAERLYNLTTLQ